MTRGDGIYLRHVIDAIVKVEDYLQGVDEVQFTSQSLIQDGVIRQIEIIGEAVKHLSPQLRNRYSHIPWRDIAGMRDKLIHHYFSVDIQAVWLTATADLPGLKAEMQVILHDLGYG
jgi:uncharacterized protein with HEPN domain